MDCPVSAQYQPALSCFSVQNQQRILGYLAGLAARHYADTTLSAVVTTLNGLIRHLTGRRKVALTDDITQTIIRRSFAGSIFLYAPFMRVRACIIIVVSGDYAVYQMARRSVEGRRQGEMCRQGQAEERLLSP
jgi:hypothetical protein